MQKVTLVLPVLPHYRIDLLTLLSSEYEKKGIKLTVITGTNAGKKSVKEVKAEGFELIHNETVGLTIAKFEIQWQKKLISSVMRTSPDKVIILYHAGKINYNLLLLKLQRRRIPYVLWGSGSGDRRTDLSPVQRYVKAWFKSTFIEKSHTYLTYGTMFKEQLIKQGYPKERIYVAQNTINVEGIYNQAEAKQLRSAGVPLKFLFVGVIFNNKRLDTAIEAFRILAEKGYDFRFDVVGNGEIISTLQQMVDEYGLSDKIIFHGPKYGDEVKAFFQGADVFLLPGTGGLAVNEAMAHGLPVITTPGDGTAYDLIENKVNGFILDFDYKVEDLEKCLSFFAEQSPESILEMGTKSREIIKSKASLANMVNQIVKSSKHIVS
ncbi:MAG: glycosyltransferase family 4 protein [Cytophagales bacterium]|nr:glycosyltransferase family 4 protein [Cytophagales bacterium]